MHDRTAAFSQASWQLVLVKLKGSDLEVAVSAFQYARFFDPAKINELKPTSNDIEHLCALPFLDNNIIINGLKAELTSYMAKADELTVNADKLNWWKKHEAELPLWSSSCKSVLLHCSRESIFPSAKFF